MMLRLSVVVAVTRKDKPSQAGKLIVMGTMVMMKKKEKRLSWTAQNPQDSRLLLLCAGD